MVLDFDTTGLAIGIILLLLFLYLYYYATKDKYQNLPPGPPGLPIFGHLLPLSRSTEVSTVLEELAKKYGPVVSLKLGSRRAVSLSGYDVIKEALVDKADTFSDRPIDLPMLKRHKREGGILYAHDWKTRRRLLLVSMRDFGLGKKSLDEKICEEARYLVDELGNKGGEPFDPHVLIPIVTTNIVCSIIRGERFSYEDKEVQMMASAIQALTTSSEFGSIENFVSWAKYFPLPFLKDTGQHKSDAFRVIMPIISRWISQHKANLDQDNIQDLIDHFIVENLRQNTNVKDRDILTIIGELFVAGTETTSTTIIWALAYLLIYPDVQEKCRDEILRIVGRSRLPETKDLKNLTYVHAVLHEIQRSANIVPLSLLHKCNEDSQLAGYSIPAGTIVIPNLGSALRDPVHWTTPEKFKPERWIDADGNLIKHPAFIPFSIGKRSCLGESLARKEYFIFLTSMLQNFRFCLDGDPEQLQKPAAEGTIRCAPPFLLKAIRI